MRKLMWIAAAAAILSLTILPAASVFAQEAGTLTQADIDNFIRDYPEFVKWANEKGDVWDKTQAMSGGTEVNDELRNYLADKGWDVQKFFYVFMGVVQETIMPMMGGGGDMTAMLQSQREMVANNPDIPADQKEQALAQIDQAIAQAGSGSGMGMEINPADKELIQANKAGLMEALSAVE